jgi:hypothetical protein
MDQTKQSRQRAWQLRRKEEGNCSCCGNKRDEKSKSKHFCSECHERKKREGRNKYRLKVGIPLDAPKHATSSKKPNKKKP